MCTSSALDLAQSCFCAIGDHGSDRTDINLAADVRSEIIVHDAQHPERSPRQRIQPIIIAGDSPLTTFGAGISRTTLEK